MAAENERERDAYIARMQQDTEQVEDFLRSAHAPRKHDDGVCRTHERQRRFSMSGMMIRLLTMGFGDSGGNDSRLGDADVAVLAPALLGVTDGCALHWPLHRPRPHPVQMSSSRSPS